MTYVLNKLLKMKRPDEPPLFAPGQPCFHKCTKCEVYPKHGCHKCKKVQNDCMQCMKNKPYKLLKMGMVGGPSISFFWYHKSGKSRICSYTDVKTCAKG